MEDIVTALERLAAGDSAGGCAILEHSADRSPLRRELLRYLEARDDGRVYDDPAAFQAFIGGTRNTRLYAATARRLAAAYADRDVCAVLDVGAGDGQAALAALEQYPVPIERLDLLEPSSALLDTARSRAAEQNLPVHLHNTTLGAFLAEGYEAWWDVAQSTFALSAIPPAERSEQLAALRSLAEHLVVVEFDVPPFEDGSREHLTYLAERYELGLAEFEHDGGSVAQGFLVPVLLGQVEPGRTRNTWEQPAQHWAGQLSDAGWQQVEVEPLSEFWWAPAVVVSGAAR